MKKYLAVFLFFCIPVFVFAHGEGESFETITGGYVIDVGYSEPAPAAGEAVSFDFKLRPEGSAEGAETAFSSVWVRIESETGEFLFASGVANAEFGGARMSYAFPHEGTYTIEVRYENGGESVADAKFPLTVAPAAADQNVPDVGKITYLFAGLVAGAGVTLLLTRRLMRPKS